MPRDRGACGQDASRLDVWNIRFMGPPLAKRKVLCEVLGTIIPKCDLITLDGRKVWASQFAFRATVEDANRIIIDVFCVAANPKDDVSVCVKLV